ncbi:hypothetical protein [Paraburkholderia podalyriae]
MNIVLQLLAQADVLVRNLPPGAMQRP